ncbi:MULTISPECIES: rhodanese-like domain-containing protein [unclassified Prochlorococcus]|uniref:rhodanese-like domain-containing protein n=1 Tax=unclassified Prochlorococcus TaxID=2627481 RepID=UPI00053374F1|nr:MULTISPECIES: rhodanese-like domain-containing protein [unclassified Prochlorococcus]KGG16775.1 Rhodanese-related sulfurtransferase [Prochlorococcus sp. MIT 0602]KGG18251.1 Rhodanese-related sulfurtransferase [Prochlorococcus sp. MIT 0603]
MNQKNPSQISPEKLKEFLNEASPSLSLVDVREKEELLIAPFTYKVFHLPLSDFTSWAKDISYQLPIEKPVVAICHSGIRSFNFGIWLIEQDSRYQVWNLEGGIDSWSQSIDPSVKRY